VQVIPHGVDERDKLAIDPAFTQGKLTADSISAGEGSMGECDRRIPLTNAA